MTEAYSPIVRTFCQFRAALRDNVDVGRHEVRPGTPLDTLLPVSGRREVWERLRLSGLRLPGLELSERDHRRNLLRVLEATASAALHMQSWYAVVVAFPLALAVVLRLSRRRAVHFPLGLKTVGEIVIYATCFADHKASGYRWTRNEIALKVRIITAECLGLPLDAVQLESRFVDLGVD